MMHEAKKLKYTALDGISEKQLKEHHDVLYAGYVKKLNEIEEKLQNADRSLANATYSEFGELKREETFAANGIKLHEGYFDGMTPGGKKDGGLVERWIAEDFGSTEAWETDFTSLGLASRGWVVLAFDLDTGKLKNILCDSHNQGGVWNAVALLVMDVYEHAYFIDFATARKAYIAAYMKNVDWAEPNGVIRKFGLETFRK